MSAKIVCAFLLVAFAAFALADKVDLKTDSALGLGYAGLGGLYGGYGGYSGYGSYGAYPYNLGYGGSVVRAGAYPYASSGYGYGYPYGGLSYGNSYYSSPYASYGYGY